MRHQQLTRLNQIYSQTFFLIDRKSEDSNHYSFMISGSTANLYRVKVDLTQTDDLYQLIKCDCPDMKKWARQNEVKCKHCCFVWVKILRLNSEWLEQDGLREEQAKRLKENCRGGIVRRELINQSYQEKYQRLVSRKAETGEQKESKKMGDRDESGLKTVYGVTKELEEEDDCPICFDELKVENSFQCPTCRNVVHQACMKKWISTGHRNCVYCRSDWTELVQENQKQKRSEVKIFNYDNLDQV